jgi:hypothetical protein
LVSAERFQRLPWHFLYFFRDPQGHGAFTGIFGPRCGAVRGGSESGFHCGGGVIVRMRPIILRCICNSVRPSSLKPDS